MLRRALPLLLLSVTPALSQTPDAIYTNGRIWTGDLDRPWAEALAVHDGTLIAVGSTADAESLAGPDTERSDFGGGFVVPGFIDSHVHFLNGGFGLASINLRDAATPENFAERIGAFAATMAPGEWILGGDWDHELWGGTEPERAWIDSLTPDNPVFVSRLDLHMALANSVALEQAGITRDTPDPDGGTIVRDPASGEPTGLLKDAAMGLVFRVVPEPSETALDTALDTAMAHAVAHGVTQVHDVGTFGGWTDLETFRRAHGGDRMRVRIYSIVPLASWQRLADHVEANGRGDDRLWWGGLKGFVDGSLGSTTAWFYDPYVDAPETSGLIVTDTTALRDRILNADARGLHLAIHAIGDRANDWLLGAYADAVEANGPRDRRFRIEHAQHLTREAIGCFASQDVIASMQPYHAIDDGRWAGKRIGDRVATTYAFRDLLDAGARLAFGSDWTVAPLDPLAGIYGAVTRQTIDGANPDGWVPEQKITLEEALRAYTTSAAYAGFREASTGRLAPGYHADFVVLSENLFEIDPVEIERVRVLQTVVGGRQVFRLSR